MSLSRVRRALRAPCQVPSRAADRLATASVTVAGVLAVADFCDVCEITLCDLCESQTRFRCSEIELEVCDGCLVSFGSGGIWGAGRISARTK